MRRILHFVLSILSRTPLIRWFRSARALRDQYVDPQVRQLRAVIKEMRAGEIDVLFLGDSSAKFFGEDDADKRQLPEMLESELAGGLRVGAILGPGYGPALYAEFVRILATLEQRPKAVVLSRAIRMCGAAHITEHPEYGYRRSVETLRTVPDAEHRLRTFNRTNRRTPEQYEAFNDVRPVTKWQQCATIGEYLTTVRGRRFKAESVTVQRALFDYFHGEEFAPDFPGAQDLRVLGERLRSYGVPVVHYYPPIPWQHGEKYFPGEFRAHTQTQWEIVHAPFVEAAGDVAHLLETPFDTPEDEFIDPADGTEHWNERGRRRIAAGLARALRAAGV